MRRLIPRQIPALHRIGQRHRLPKSQRQSLTRNRIDATRSIAHQRDIPTNHMPQFTRHRNRTAFTPHQLRAIKAPRQLRKLIRQRRLIHPALARKRCYTNFLRPQWRDIRLRSISPMTSSKSDQGRIR